MKQPSSSEPPRAAAATRAQAFGVHVFTATGGGVALIALLEAVREHWAGMFGWLGLALLIDALDGPMARKYGVSDKLPNWSGDTLDLVVDFVTYVFVPAYAITASGLLVPVTAPLLGGAIVVSGALYFADKRMKQDDNYFRGFPALWNAAAFYLFLLKPSAALGSLFLAVLVALTFVPFRVPHPVRTRRFRRFNMAAIIVWATLALVIMLQSFEVGWPIKALFCAIGLYILFGDAVLRTMGLTRT